MPFNHSRPGVAHVGSYQVSGRPWITGSADIDNNVQHHHKFPAVAKSVTVINRADVPLRVHFNDKADPGVVGGLHYITLSTTKDKHTFNVRCKEIFVTSTGDNGAYEIAAELTSISADDMFALTGSGLTDPFGS
tara:strand:- start:170 stop:571 length:402 start_codon:yes stop_codon:yes gene_type:complete